MTQLPQMRDAQEMRDVSSRASELVRRATTHVIADARSANVAVEMLRDLRSLIERVEDWFRPMVESVNAARGELLAKRREITAPLEHASDHLRKDLAGYLASATSDDRPDGVSLRSRVTVTVTDERAAVEYLARHGHHDALAINIARLQSVAAAMGDRITIPGVTICRSGTVAISRAPERSQPGSTQS